MCHAICYTHLSIPPTHLHTHADTHLRHLGEDHGADLLGEEGLGLPAELHLHGRLGILADHLPFVCGRECECVGVRIAGRMLASVYAIRTRSV